MLRRRGCRKPASSCSQKEILLGIDMTLDEWLKAISVPDTLRDFNVFPTNCFPTDEHCDRYLDSINDRTDQEIRSLLRSFLVNSGIYGADRRRIKNIKLFVNTLELAAKNEYVRRLLNPTELNWEGITWILDILDCPQKAIQAIDSYILAHNLWMTDQMFYGLCDAMAIIRARYIERSHPRTVLLGIDWRDFELLVASLFSHIGFNVTTTRRSRDGGYDMEITRYETSRLEKSIIECKRHYQNIGVKEVRALLGVVERKQATRGIIVATTRFTKTAKEEARNTGRLELIDYESLCQLFNEHFGPEWPICIDGLVSTARRNFENDNTQSVVDL